MSGGKRDRANGILSSKEFPAIRGYLGRYSGGEVSVESTRRPAGNGLGGEGSAASFSSDGKRDSGSLCLKGFSPSSEYLKTGLGGEGVCPTGREIDGEMGAGRAMHRENRSAATGEKTAHFMALFWKVDVLEAVYQDDRRESL